MTPSLFSRTLAHEAAGGVALMLATFAALIVANSPLQGAYVAALEAPLSITLAGTGLTKPLILWINDGLMAVFFFLIGLELKREVLEGKLRRLSDIVLPGVAALGGMLVPAVVYLAFNLGGEVRGWAIPTATDIAFALGVLALVGKGLPTGLKTFLLTLAILDDLGAIMIIAVFYTDHLQLTYLGLALIPVAGLYLLNRSKTPRVAPALLLGAILWVLVLKSGVHATLAGVATAFFIPLRDRAGGSPLELLEHGLQPYVAFLIVPLFAFANAGLDLSGMSWAALTSPLTMGIALGLLVGKFAGVMAACWIMVRTGFAELPQGAGWAHLAGLALLAGIGFTMSLFIGGLSFGEGATMNSVRLGVLAGSAVAALAGFAVLRSLRS
ncbi:MAG: Na+/H+ antiporter NhaA [Candidatus Saccharibacteria bacterium]|nr:Na+/H+ antiporter NhaA [Pseudorhodobacter sp.]